MTMADDFFGAIRAGESDRVLALLEEAPTLASARQANVSATLTAAYHGRQDLARLIASRCSDLSLHEACAIGDEAAALRLLAGNPAMIDVPGADGHYPLGLAIFFGHGALARMLIEAGADVKLHSKNEQNVAPIHAAAAVCDRAVLELLLERGADPNSRQQSEYAALHTAAGRGDTETASLLLRFGATRDPRGSDGKTPLDLARERGQENFAAWLESQ
jgi:ankyrin repeat protein